MSFINDDVCSDKSGCLNTNIGQNQNIIVNPVEPRQTISGRGC